MPDEYLRFCGGLDELRMLVDAADWDALDTALSHATECDLVRRVRAGDLTAYTTELHHGLATSLDRALAYRCPAVYFEFDMANGWDGTFVICDDYRPGDRDDGWIDTGRDRMAGPGLPCFAEIFDELGGFSDSADNVEATLVMIARTTAALGRVAQRLDTHGIVVAAGYHDQGGCFYVARPAPSTTPNYEAMSSEQRSRILEDLKRSRVDQAFSELDDGVPTEQRHAIEEIVRNGGSASDTYVYYEDQPIGDDALTPIAKLPRVSMVTLSDTRVTDAGMQHLKGLRFLKAVTLERTAVTDEGLSQLLGCPLLEWVGAINTSITEMGAGDFTRQFADRHGRAVKVYRTPDDHVDELFADFPDI